MRAQDRFRDWNLYHKSVALLVAGGALWVIAHAAFVYDGAFRVTTERTIPTDSLTLWPWVTGDETRSKWSAYLIDTGVLMGDEGKTDTTRLLFWRKGLHRWHSVEKVTESLPGRVFSTYQEADHDNRWWRVELAPAGPCKTRVSITEIIYPLEYKDRFWFFLEQADQEKRLTNSLEALNRWVGRGPACTAVPQENEEN